MLQNPPSHLNVRTPSFNISNGNSFTLLFYFIIYIVIVSYLIMYTINLLFTVIDISNNSFQSSLPNIILDSNDKFKGVVHQNKNVSTSILSVYMSKQQMLQTSHSHLNVRTPLSNISNGN
uniref:Transmembrane protein n=1 Tax=Lactuca sativa TaxID=4236 RepID=A0A9R1X200_LACSA|nr:hypothetical protein LSAT_V11C700379810 [Lactuca sativa]